MDAKLDAVLAASGGARQAMAKDGACQFAAVVVQVSSWTVATLRKAAVDMLEQDDMLAGFAAVEGGVEYLARLRRSDGWGDSLSLEAICRAAGLSVWVLTVSEKGVPGLFRMGEEGWILAFLTQRPGHYDAFTVPEALQQAVKDGWLCLREGRLVAAEADGAATAAVDGSAMGGGMADAPAPTPQPPPAGVGPQSVQEYVVEVAVVEADGDGAAGGILTDAPAPASQSSSPVVADPPMAGAAAACKPRSVKEHVSQADRRAGYREVTTAEQAAKRADVQSQRRGAQAAARLRQARCGRGDEEEGVGAGHTCGVAIVGCCSRGARRGECDGAGLAGECLLLPCAQRARDASAGQHGVAV